MSAHQIAAMSRRRLLFGTSAVVTWPRLASAQQSAIPLVGILNSGISGGSPIAAGFGQGLAETGFVDGRNVKIEYRFAEGHYERLTDLIADLTSRNVAVLVATGGVHTALAAKPVSSRIPVIFAIGNDPLRFGLVQALNRPGGNMTGVSFFTGLLESKRLGLLSQLVPNARRLGVLINPAGGNAANQLQDVEQGGRALGRSVVTTNAVNDGEIESAFQTLSRHPVDALLIAADPFFFGRREKIVALAAQYKLPAIYEWREFAQAGGLASYGTNLNDNYRLAGTLTGRILKGEKAADLPVIQASKFEFVINLKTARALGIEVPLGVSAGADEIIE